MLQIWSPIIFSAITNWVTLITFIDTSLLQYNEHKIPVTEIKIKIISWHALTNIVICTYIRTLNLGLLFTTLNCYGKSVKCSNSVYFYINRSVSATKINGSACMVVRLNECWQICVNKYLIFTYCIERILYRKNSYHYKQIVNAFA